MNNIRRLSHANIADVTSVHLKSFPGFFLTFMGSAFLNEFYAAVIRDDTHIAFISLQDDKINGFVVGTTQPGGIYKRLIIRFGLRIAFASIRPVLKNPAIILHLFNRLLFVEGVNYAPDEALLMSIAVLPEFEGRGIGRNLVTAFTLEARTRMVNKVFLTTDKNNNERANRFYQRLGFERVRSFTTSEGREMNEYRIIVA